ncbi:hypothetical protein [Streptomyces sp. NPDC086787]|uniref:hypothetical protein n=1 Tax=Streptomyces sp. NPDC086787 TaxID=3365759 RepID=UPI0037F2352D
MAQNTKTGRRRPAAPSTIARGVCAAGVLLLTLSGCAGHGQGATAANNGPQASGGSTKAPDGSTKTPGGTATPAPGHTGAAAKPTAGGGSAAGAAPAVPASKVTGTPGAAGSGADDGCDHRMPISPDEVAVYRYSPEGGSLTLVVKHGNWGCPAADSDGAPFVTTGKETALPMDQAAYVTATNPVVESTENQRIGVQEFLDWLDAHPDSGLVFRYHLGADGAVDSLEEVFTP